MSHLKAELYAYDLTEAIWRKASAGGAEHDCVEIAQLPAGGRAVRDSKDPGRAALRFTASEWTASRKGVVTGRL